MAGSGNFLSRMLRSNGSALYRPGWLTHGSQDQSRLNPRLADITLLHDDDAEDAVVIGCAERERASNDDDERRDRPGRLSSRSDRPRESLGRESAGRASRTTRIRRIGPPPKACQRTKSSRPSLARSPAANIFFFHHIKSAPLARKYVTRRKFTGGISTSSST